MRETNSNSKHESPRDGTLRIHRRRAGIYQPKDSLGLSCILQGGDIEEISQPLLKRQTMTAPRDNIGISCLPTRNKNISNETETAESETSKDRALTPRQNRIRKTEEYLSKVRDGAELDSLLNSVIESFNETHSAKDDSKKVVNGVSEKKSGPKTSKKSVNKIKEQKSTTLKNTKSDIGLSNIRRPKNEALKMRKPILPKDNIGSSCKLLQKSSILRTSLGSTDKRVTNKSLKKQNILQTQSAVNLKEKKSSISILTRNQTSKKNR